MTARQWDVVIVGAGPVGSLLAGALAGRGLSVLVLERDRTVPDQTRASTLNSRSMEILSALGVPGLEGHPHSMVGHYGGIPVRLDEIDSPWAGLWSIPQPRLVRMLRDWAVDAGATMKTGTTFTGAEAVAAAMKSRTSSGVTHESRVLVGADGAGSAVRDGLAFSPRHTAANRFMVRCDVEGITVARRRFERHGDVVATAGAISPRITRLMFYSPDYDATSVPTFDQVARDWFDATGEDVSGGDCVWLDTFSNATSTVGNWKVGNAYLIGDAAHDQPPVGGNSLNAGLHDVYNLAWKLAAVHGGSAPGELAATYEAERAEATATMQREVREQEAMIFGADTEPGRVLRDRLAESAALRQDIARSIAGVDTEYTGTRTGRRVSPSGLAQALGRPLADYEEAALGREAILAVGDSADDVGLAIRPDGHLAWSPDLSSDLADSAVTRWFGNFLSPVLLKAG
ncbi:2-polyprenyl-6-methoxyphenol hydroxylase-like FAD-dependent oxidoreductase [Nocardia transvalensis]|uniref:2-polyprenyl-6-methoxyphenol hydroxylase-like FAD-dependent oxidoreductase n=1 Tax=Nocardia transvalensis TaxID=37333 RepID=A0A7W9PLE2_9NOCA|nr:FAD-dependent monooxygenase [Nocardia transvalensis]MBB5918324.1 2-polyprenyl-6-methoxyphenol hydroxylase-like FAD-dependent oxidoreductase [Nocardia transvalensis]